MADTSPELQAIINPPVSYRDRRAEAYRARLGKLPGNTQMETVGDVLDAVIKAVIGGDVTELQAIAAEVQRIKQEIPKPAEPSAGKRI